MTPGSQALAPGACERLVPALLNHLVCGPCCGRLHKRSLRTPGTMPCAPLFPPLLSLVSSALASPCGVWSAQRLCYVCARAAQLCAAASLTLALIVVLAGVLLALHSDGQVPVHAGDLGHGLRLQQDDAVVTFAPGQRAVLQRPGLVHLVIAVTVSLGGLARPTPTTLGSRMAWGRAVHLPCAAPAADPAPHPCASFHPELPMKGH